MSKLRNPKKSGYSCHEGGGVHFAPRDPRLLPLPELPGVRPPGARVAPPLLRGRQGELWLVKWSQYSPLIGPGLPPPLLHPRPLQPAAAPHRPRVAARGLHHAAGQKIFVWLEKYFAMSSGRWRGPWLWTRRTTWWPPRWSWPSTGRTSDSSSGYFIAIQITYWPLRTVFISNFKHFNCVTI